MLGTKPVLPQESPFETHSHRRRIARAGLGAMLAVGLTGIVALVLAALTMLPVVQVSIDGITMELPPDTPIVISTVGIGEVFADIALHKLTYGADGEFILADAVPTSLAPVAEGSSPSVWSNLQLQRFDGANPLDFDGLYRLRIAVNTRALAFPLPEAVLLTHDFVFSTPTTPRPHAPDAVVELRYQEPLAIAWNAPIEDFAVEVAPLAEAQTWIDPRNPTTSYVDLQGAEPGSRYEMRVVAALGANGAPLISPATLAVETAAAPSPIAESAKVEDGHRVVIHWDRPLDTLAYEITPSVGSAVEVDAHDKRVSYILLDSPQQGHEYEIRITGGAGASGAPLTDTYELTVATPLPLEISELSPRGGAYGVKPDRPISIKFAEPIQNRTAAEAAITIEPAIAGRFEWPEPDRVQFVPQHTLPYLTRINVTIQPGPAGARGASGGYLEEEVDYSFLTQPNKLIVVDLTRQRLTLYEGDKSVYTTLVATGVRFAETPTGDFIIHLKWPALRMRGVNPSGTRYDIPNVPWVMQFLGDYTFHSAPWRSQFGFPQSNGCVSMETGAAKYVYDWTPIGTPVRIHY